MCPGGAVNFAAGAVTFDPAWIYGCNTGTSCNGGVNFDNRFSCQPTTAMDACAPAPTCGVPANNGSNIWFKFYAAASTVTISCFQNTSFVIAVQAFSGGPTCGSLTQIGCAVAGGPSSGVNLTLTGLTVGELYYYRIFGSSGPVSQRTGIYCFCGSAGLDYYVLASGLESFKGYANDQTVKLTWQTNELLTTEFSIEVSNDKVLFNTVAVVPAGYNKKDYSYTFMPSDNRELYYRLRFINASGQVKYSPTLKLKAKGAVNGVFTYYNNTKQLRVRVEKASSYLLCSTAGAVVRQYMLKPGDNLLTLGKLSFGVYFFRNADGNDVHKLAVLD